MRYPVKAPVRALAFDDSGGRLAVGYGEIPGNAHSATAQPILIWDTSKAGNPVGSRAGLAGDVRAVAYSSHGDLASGGSDYLNVRDSAGEVNVLVQNDRGRFTAVAFSPDAATLAAAGRAPHQAANSFVGLWDPTKPDDQPIGTLESLRRSGWDGAFRSLAFGPGGLLAGAGEAGLQLWDTQTLRPIGGLSSVALTSVVVSVDGAHVLVGGDDGRVQSYPATLAGWQADACSVVSRNLSVVEWQNFVRSALPYEATCPQYPAG